MHDARLKGRQWMLTALADFGDTDGGTNVDMAERLSMFGVDVIPPPEPDADKMARPDRPYPKTPTAAWLSSTLREHGQTANPNDKVESLIARCKALGFTEIS